MAIVLQDEAALPVLSTGATISAVLPDGNPTAGWKCVAAVHIVNGAGLPAVSGWTVSNQQLRTLNVAQSIGFYWRDVVGGQETACRTFTLPVNTNVQSIAWFGAISGAPSGAPQITGGKIDQAGGTTGLSGTTGVPARGGGFVIAAIGTDGTNGGYVDDATYPTNGYTHHSVTTALTFRTVALIRENVTAVAQSTEAKWTTWRYPVASIIGFVPAAAPPPANVPPVANAGTDQSVAQGDTVILAGSGVDSDGTIAAYEWTPPFGQTLTNSEIQTITIGGSGLTSYTLTYSGQTTAAISPTADAATLVTRLEALSNIAVGDVAVTGAAGGPYRVTFRGALVNTNVAQMTSTPTGGTGTVTIATLRAGAATSATTIANPTWYTGSVDGGDYTFSLRVQDDDGAWSTPDTVRVTVVGPPPAPPTPGVTEIPQWVTPKITYSAPFNAASRVIRLIRSGGTGTGTGGDALPYTLPFVLGAASASGDSALVRKVFSGPGAAASFSVGGAGTIITIERSEDGVVGVPVRGATGVSPENGELEIIDGEATPQKLHYWRARATDVTEGVIRTSAWSEWVELTPDPILPSVKDPTDPEATILLTVLDFGGESSSRLATEHQTFGQEAPVVVANGWTSSRGTCTVLVDSKLQREMLRTLIRSEAKLLLQRPTEDGLEEGEQWYIEPLGELPVARLTAQKYAGRTIAFSWREVAKP